MSNNKRIKLNVNGCQYPLGRIGLTTVIGDANEKSDCVSFDDVVPIAGLSKACLSSFAIDDDWLMAKLGTVPKLCIVRQKPNDVPTDIGMLQISQQLLFVFPEMKNGFGCMHIKLMLLFYSDYLRVVIGSANLIPFDWQRIENVVFFQDFPLADGEPIGSPFGSDLVMCLRQMGVPETVVDSVTNYDFTNARAELVLSRPGKPVDCLVGQKRLKEVVAKIAQRHHVDFSTVIPSLYSSSIGNCATDWLKQMLVSCRGIEETPDTFIDIQIVYPTDSYIRNSKAGALGGGTIFFQRRFWNDNFPKSVLHKSITTRHGLTSHSKLIVSQIPGTTVKPNIRTIYNSTECPDGYIYIGSHNATKAAWGYLNSKHNVISNWELGVIFPFQFTDCSISLTPILKMPFVYPSPKYDPDDKPWM